MNHLILFLIYILSVEIFIRFRFVDQLKLILKVTKKVTHVILQKNISDHWKEKVIPVYAFKIMKFSLKIFFILILVVSLFLIFDIFFNSLLIFTFSLIGILESIIFAFGYLYCRKLIQ